MFAKDECTVQKINILKIQRTRHPLNFQAKTNKFTFIRTNYNIYKRKRKKSSVDTTVTEVRSIDRTEKKPKKNMCFSKQKIEKKDSRIFHSLMWYKGDDFLRKELSVPFESDSRTFFKIKKKAQGENVDWRDERKCKM